MGSKNAKNGVYLIMFLQIPSHTPFHTHLNIPIHAENIALAHMFCVFNA